MSSNRNSYFAATNALHARSAPDYLQDTAEKYDSDAENNAMK